MNDDTMVEAANEPNGAGFRSTESGQECGPNEQVFHELGIDVGAITTKVILLKNGRSLVGSLVRPTSMEPGKLVEEMVTTLLQEHGLSRTSIRNIVATGQGRKAILMATMARTEITAFARGAFFLAPEATVAVDIGGQGIRVMKIGEMGIISDFRTNDKCSSGTGCFMDTMAVALAVGIDGMGDPSLDSIHPETISTTCTVFAESEVVSLVAKGKTKEAIISGLNVMVAKKIAALIHATRSHGPVLLGGGVAMNNGIIAELGKMIDQEIVVPRDPQLVGAIGAAILAPKPDDGDEGDIPGESALSGGSGGDGNVKGRSRFLSRLRSRRGGRKA